MAPLPPVFPPASPPPPQSDPQSSASRRSRHSRWTAKTRPRPGPAVRRPERLEYSARQAGARRKTPETGRRLGLEGQKSQNQVGKSLQENDPRPKVLRRSAMAGRNQNRRLQRRFQRLVRRQHHAAARQAAGRGGLRQEPEGDRENTAANSLHRVGRHHPGAERGPADAGQPAGRDGGPSETRYGPRVGHGGGAGRIGRRRPPERGWRASWRGRRRSAGDAHW